MYVCNDITTAAAAARVVVVTSKRDMGGDVHVRGA
jgi:hypothetical protein